MPPLRPASTSIGPAAPIVVSLTSQCDARSPSPTSAHQSSLERPKRLLRWASAVAAIPRVRARASQVRSIDSLHPLDGNRECGVYAGSEDPACVAGLLLFAAL